MVNRSYVSLDAKKGAEVSNKEKEEWSFKGEGTAHEKRKQIN